VKAVNQNFTDIPTCVHVFCPYSKLSVLTLSFGVQEAPASHLFYSLLDFCKFCLKRLDELSDLKTAYCHQLYLVPVLI
jgi:hypothetical protein